MGSSSAKQIRCTHCNELASARHRLTDDSGVIDVVYTCGSKRCAKGADVVDWPVLRCYPCFRNSEGHMFSHPTYCVCGDKIHGVVKYVCDDCEFGICDDVNDALTIPGVYTYFFKGRTYVGVYKWCGYYEDCSRLPPTAPEEFRMGEVIVAPSGCFQK